MVIPTVSGVIALRILSAEMAMFFRSTSTKTGVNPRLTSGAMSDTQPMGGTITSPSPFCSFSTEAMI